MRIRRLCHYGIREAFKTVISAETAAYRDQSFFHMLKEGKPIPEPHLFYQKDVGDDHFERHSEEADEEGLGEDAVDTDEDDAVGDGSDAGYGPGSA